MSALSPLDPSSYSRPELAVMKHASIALNVNFDTKVLSGTVLLSFDVLQDINELSLDVSDLTIENVELENGTTLNHKIDGHVANFGSKLTIDIPGIKSNEKSVSSLPTQDGCRVSEFVLYKPEDNIGCDKLRAYDSGKLVLETDKSNSSRDDNVRCICTQNDDTQSDSIASETGLKIKIKYSTSPTASALQWLEPKQTSEKKYPYLFSQCQPIHARSIIPCQDTPAVKFTYDAQITAPAEFTVLMSALRKESKEGNTKFQQTVPIPSYLLALAVGVIESRSLGPRSLVWAEKGVVERSAWEFAETEKYLQAAEALCGPYQWSQYDLLVLPPSFPYGGMENPCLTFVTPTLLAGDRSQADVIVHEIMHSWTGNLVTNRNFEHFWLNEGFTVFLERKVGASLIPDKAEAKKSRDFHSLLGLQELKEAIQTLNPTNPLTSLVVDLKGVHPDDAFSRVPYEKGSLFLRYLEDLVGGAEVFDDWLRSYLNKFQRKSIDTGDFKEHLMEYFKSNNTISVSLNSVDWDTWLHSPGMPKIIPDYDTSMTKAVTSLRTKITESEEALNHEDVKDFSPHQIIHLLQDLIDSPPLSITRLHTLGAEYKVNDSKNTEIVYRWLRLCIRSKDSSKLSEVFSFVNKQGRMKYVRPIYRDLYSWEDIREQAIDNFLKNESSMMHVTAYTLRKDLHLSD